MLSASLIAFTVASVAAGVMATRVSAQSALQLTAIPPREGDDGSLVVNPGETQQVDLRVRNESDQPLSILSTVTDFILGEDGVTPIPVDSATSNRWSLASWVTVAPGEQVLQPGETAGLNVLISVPEDALPGGHYAMVTHEPNYGSNDTDIEDAASQVSQKVGTLLYLKVAGAINEEAFIRDFSAPQFSEYGPVPFTYTIENQSDIHIAPKMRIDIKNMFGTTVSSLEVESKNVFPLMSRDFETQWDQIWGIGPYTAELTTSFGENGQVIMAKTSFWLLPVTLIIAIIVLVLTLVGVLVAIRRHWLHRNSDDKARIKHLEDRLKSLEGDRLSDFEE